MTRLVQCLPKAGFERIPTSALDYGHRKQPFSEDSLLEVTPSTTLVEYVPLSELWSAVVMPKIAQAHGLAESAGRLRRSIRRSRRGASTHLRATS